MTQSVYLMILLLCLRLMCPLATGIFMEKLISKKLCAADDCVYTISLARAEEDYIASDCRFINIKKGQLIYVYSKLMNEKDSGEFWAASIRVYGEQYEDHMGTVGYFPSSLVSEQHVYQEASKTTPTRMVTPNVILQKEVEETPGQRRPAGDSGAAGL
ncbi:otoraplin [Corvus kubaryi]|uniref:otoraplin n=1 Tax=Corvus kubaryi TaxID=68294 RepID=UPI0004DDEC3C|nr:otoraplin [Corvus kubaryi]